MVSLQETMFLVKAGSAWVIGQGSDDVGVDDSIRQQLGKMVSILWKNIPRKTLGFVSQDPQHALTIINLLLQRNERMQGTLENKEIGILSRNTVPLIFPIRDAFWKFLTNANGLDYLERGIVEVLGNDGARGNERNVQVNIGEIKKLNIENREIKCRKMKKQSTLRYVVTHSHRIFPFTASIQREKDENTHCINTLRGHGPPLAGLDREERKMRKEPLTKKEEMKR
ncbi:hypothetical protein WN51_11028 [Melipona quadrifasciata]|uniref:Uncharacterized protein n=1 Tax=Melipona quadrifasciata TaxID=166423 RepID=A0A0M9A3U6_9HYME|nr:hypothetical protein WN51_11028 [Melipona quadrifasciata]